MAGPLSGYRIVDCTAMLSGPVATRILADPGADVILVERPGSGDLVRAMGGSDDGPSAALRRHAPSLGEHPDEVLAELGLSQAEIQRLRREAIVA